MNKKAAVFSSFFRYKKKDLEAHSLLEVNKYIKQVIGLNFQESIWVKAEISQIKESRGQYYIELIQKEENTDEVVAKIAAVIWFKSYLFIQKKLGDLSEQILSEGTSIQCKVRIDFHVKYGLKFTIEDIDPSYTFGQLELQRQKTIEKLKTENLLGKNRLETSPGPVIQRIAMISSETAAGLQDFIMQLKNNPYDFAFDTRLYPSAVQGSLLEREMLKRLDEINEYYHLFDCVVIIRGGGSKLDLAGFDSYAIAKKVANFPIPVLSGIGHDIDQNIIELVTFEALKTPTAVANYLIDHNLMYESSMQQLFSIIQDRSKIILKDRSNSLTQSSQKIRYLSDNLLNNSKLELQKMKDFIYRDFKSFIDNKKNELEHIKQQIELSDPSKILSKGYSITYKNNKQVSSISDVSLNDMLSIHFNDGKAHSIIKEISPKKQNKAH